MTDSLRTRIAAALYKAGDNRISPGMCRQQADAVISELGLREQRSKRSYGNWPNQPQVVFRPARRYVTEWKWETEDE